MIGTVGDKTHCWKFYRHLFLHDPFCLKYTVGIL